jgi:protein-S-isoprenylcysteine O-methyltransferase Ste14
MEATLLAATVAVWCVVHSLLASLPAKHFVSRFAGDGAAHAYRLGYNVFALISLAPVLILMRGLPDHTLYAIKPPWLFAMLFGQALAALCLLLALLQTDTLHFMGLRQVVERDGKSTLVTTGFYRVARHPLYLLGLLFLWLTPIMTTNLLIVFALLSIYVFVGASLEERRLLREFGAEYSPYRSHTPMIVPGLRLGRRAAREASTSSKR